jgi:hypothetical protein
VEGDGALVHRRRDAADDRSALGAHGLEEALVQRASEARTAQVGTDADEVDLGLVGIRLREEAAEEAGDPGLVLGHEARGPEVDEEQALQDVRGRAAAPPVVPRGR